MRPLDGVRVLDFTIFQQGPQVRCAGTHRLKTEPEVTDASG